MSEHHFENNCAEFSTYERPAIGNPILRTPAESPSESMDKTCESATTQPDLIISMADTDSVVYSVIEKFKKRADFGKKKYGTDLDRGDLSLHDWYNHLHEELFDSILYLEKIMQELKRREATPFGGTPFQPH